MLIVFNSSEHKNGAKLHIKCETNKLLVNILLVTNQFAGCCSLAKSARKRRMSSRIFWKSGDAV